MDRSPSRIKRLFLFLTDTLILFSLAALLLLFLAAARPRALDLHPLPISYTLRLSPLPAEYASALAVGDAVLDAVGKRQIGCVTSVKITPATTEVFDRKEKVRRRVPYPGYVVMTVEVSAKATYKGEVLSVSGLPLHRGDSIHLRFPYLTARGVCTALAT